MHKFLIFSFSKSKRENKEEKTMQSVSFDVDGKRCALSRISEYCVHKVKIHNNNFSREKNPRA